MYAIYYNRSNGYQWLWCDGLGFILICTGIAYFGVLNHLVLKRYLNLKPVIKFGKRIISSRYVQLGLYALTLVCIIVFLVLDTADNRRRLISAGGIVILIGVGFALSKHRRKVNWRQVTWGCVLQFVFGLIILRWEIGKAFIDCIGGKVDAFLAFTRDGSGFVYGHLVNRRPFNPNALPKDSIAYNITSEINSYSAGSGVVAFNALSVIYFFSFIVQMLFHYGVVQWVTIKVGWALRITIGTTPCESLNAASNIFLGQAMAPLLIRPYLNDLTLSEIHAVMTSGFATIAGTVLAAYISFGVSPAHLLSASVMSAPAALAFAKLMYPETEVPRVTSARLSLKDESSGGATNVLDAATRGASAAAMLVLNIIAIVIAFIAFISFLNTLVSFFGGLVGYENLTFELILGKIFIPLAFIMGVDWEECEDVGTLIGIKTVVNEFIAYRRLGLMIQEGRLSPRSVSITTYALCGFANPGSVGVQLATLGSLAPDRKSDIARVVIRAFVAGSAACFLTACIAGALITEEGIEAFVTNNAL